MAKQKSKDVRIVFGVALGDDNAIAIQQFVNPKKRDEQSLERVQTYDDFYVDDFGRSHNIEISIFEVNLTRPAKSVKAAKAKKIKTVKHEIKDNNPDVEEM